MNNAIPFIMQGKNIVIIVNNKPYTVTESNINHDRLKMAIMNKDWHLVPDLVTPEKSINKFAEGHFYCENGVITENGKVVHNALSSRILSMYQDGFSINPMLAFYANINKNPSKDSVDELYEFLELNSLPITEDGCFVAYKRVRENYTDCHTGTLDNSIGKIVQMPRSDVDDNRDNTCSTGLHFCSHSYLRNFSGARIMAVKINPKDTISFPRDYSLAKGRCCEYEVIGEITIEAEHTDTLSEVSLYSYHFENETDDDLNISNDFDKVCLLSLRQHALIWNELTGSNLKKFSCREDVERRIYESGEFTDDDLISTAKELNLI